jgi:hypothetical protein
MDHEGDDSEYSPSPEEFLAPQAPTLDETLGRVYSSRPLPALYGRAWLLTLLACAEGFGLTPIPGNLVHGMGLLADGLAEVYKVPSPDRAVLKSDRLPFFPSLQWDLDRLLVQGLLASWSVDRGSGGLQTVYACTVKGRELAGGLSDSPLLRRARPFLKEVVAALAGSGELDAESIAAGDSTFAAPARVGSVLDFGEWDDPRLHNYAFRTTEAFEKANTRGLPFGQRDRLHLYARYLVHVRRGAA